ncbi:MAG: Type leader peptidase family [Actinomycetota bacterium]|jgi:leader peptidase (prepilin peptidase)/N-methyltransferase
MTTMTPTTTVRVTRAWTAGTPTIRRAAAAAWLTSCLQAFGQQTPFAMRLGLAAAGCLVATAALVDLHELRLPNRLVGSALAVSLVAAATVSAAALVQSLLGMVVAGGLMLVVRLSRGVGMGDVKLAAAVGAGTGGLALPLAPLSIAVAALVAGTFGLAAGRRRLPLGPSLWFGWSVALLAARLGWF